MDRAIDYGQTQLVMDRQSIRKMRWTYLKTEKIWAQIIRKEKCNLRHGGGLLKIEGYFTLVSFCG